MLTILGGRGEIASAAPLARCLRDHVELVVVEAAAPALRASAAAHGELDELAGTDEMQQLRASEARMVLAGWNALVDCDPDRFAQALWQPAPALRPPLFGDGHAAERIAAAICEFVDVYAQRTIRRWTA